MMDKNKIALQKHNEWKGKIEICPRVDIDNADMLSIAYTPGVAAASLAIKENISESYKLTRRHNMIAVVTDGSAVLGLGNIGAAAAMPVMEGKCMLFKKFADVDAFPICISSQDIDSIVNTVYNISESFGGINLEDISAPRCFEIEKRLNEMCDIPIFHDDQHGTAIVVAAALLNALKFTGKNIKSVRIVISGAGAAGIAIAKHLLAIGAQNIIMCDKSGILYDGMDGLSAEKRELCRITNSKRIKGTLSDAMQRADVFIGVSAADIVSKDMVSSMAENAIVFPLANPIPEILPQKAYSGGAAVVGTGRSDFPNQINNVLVFPGIFRGILDSGAHKINEKMRIAATYAIANLVAEEELSKEYILPEVFDKRVASAVAKAVAGAKDDREDINA